VFILTAAIIYRNFPVGEHWFIYRTAARKLVHFENPYEVEKFFNPTWALFPVLPFALLPIKIGNALWATSTLFAFGYVARKLGASWFVTIAFVLLPHTLYNLIQINLEWLVALGYLLPPQFGLFLILIKPQLGAFLALYWFITIWKEDGLDRTIVTFTPVLLAFILTFIFFGFYLTKAQFMFGYEGKHFWPISIPIGITLFYIAIKNKKPGFALACAPLLAPYTQPYSWPVAILGFLPDNLWTFTLISTVWLYKDSGKTWMYVKIRDILFDSFLY
jgi:hypothetical protein